MAFSYIAIAPVGFWKVLGSTVPDGSWLAPTRLPNLQAAMPASSGIVATRVNRISVPHRDVESVRPCRRQLPGVGRQVAAGIGVDRRILASIVREQRQVATLKRNAHRGHAEKPRNGWWK